MRSLTLFQSPEHIRSKLEAITKQYEHALATLADVLSRTPDKGEETIYRDSAIQRFEFCFDLSWKLLKELYHLQLTKPLQTWYTGEMKKRTLADTHTGAELRVALKKSIDEGQKQRIKAIMHLKNGKTVKEVAEDLLVSRWSVSVWQRLYNEKGIEGLVTNKGGRPEGNPVWDATIFTSLTEHIAKTNGYWSVPKMQKWITDTYAKTIPLQTIWYHVCLLEFSYKSSRPHPYKGNPERQEAFKKGALSNR